MIEVMLWIWGIGLGLVCLWFYMKSRQEPKDPHEKLMGEAKSHPERRRTDGEGDE